MYTKFWLCILRHNQPPNWLVQRAFLRVEVPWKWHGVLPCRYGS
jgi:hypothetical protein